MEGNLSDVNRVMCAGRGGSCELMIGCVAKADSDNLQVDQSEMEEVRWIPRDQVAKALTRSAGANNPLLGVWMEQF